MNTIISKMLSLLLAVLLRISLGVFCLAAIMFFLADRMLDAGSVLDSFSSIQQTIENLLEFDVFPER